MQCKSMVDEEGINNICFKIQISSGMKDIVTEKKSKTTDLEVGSAVKEPIPHDRQKGWVAQFSLKSAQSN